MPPDRATCPAILLSAPDSWREALLRALEPQSRAVLAHVNTATLHWLLEEWPEAVLRLPFRAADIEQPTQLLRRIASAREDLVRRRDRPTVLLLLQCGVITADSWWQVPLAALTGLDVPKLTLALSFQRIPPALLSFAGGVLPTLRSLTLGPSTDQQGLQSVALPHPNALPALREITVQKVAADAHVGLWHSLKPYMAQLESLVIGDQPVAVAPDEYQPPEAVHGFWSVLAPPLLAPNLRRLAIPARLNPALTELLRGVAPGLEHLTVRSVCAGQYGDNHVTSEVCSWRTLRCQEDVFPPNAWQWIPLPQEGKLIVDLTAVFKPTEEPTVVDVELPIPSKVAEKLPRVEFKGVDQVRVALGSEGVREVTQQPQALRTALPLLQPHSATVQEFVVQGFTISVQLAAELGSVKAAGWKELSLQALHWPEDTPPITTPLPQVEFLDLTRPLDDALLMQLTQCVTKVNNKLYVPKAVLERPAPQGIVLPWPTVYVDRAVTVSAFVRQAELLGGGVGWILQDLEMCLTVEEVNREEHRRLANQLRTANLKHVEFASLYKSPDPNSDPALETRVLRGCLTLLAALPKQCRVTELWLLRWGATSSNLAELQALRHVPALQPDKPALSKVALLLTGNGEVVKPPNLWPITRLPLLLPKTCCTWSLNHTRLHPHEVEALILSAPADRTESQPLTIEVSHTTAEWADTMNAQLQSLGTYPYVTVVSKTT